MYLIHKKAYKNNLHCKMSDYNFIQKIKDNHQ